MFDERGDSFECEGGEHDDQSPAQLVEMLDEGHFGAVAEPTR